MSFKKLEEDFKALSKNRIEKIIRYYWLILQEDYEEEHEKFAYITSDILEDLEPWYEDDEGKKEFVYELVKQLNIETIYNEKIKQDVLDRLE